MIRAAVVIPFLVLALLTGCGDEQVKVDNAYVEATDRAVQSFETRFQQLQAAFTPVSTPEQDLQTLASLQAAVDRAFARLRQVQAPARIAPLHARLVSQVQQYSAAITTAEKDLSVDDPQRVIKARSRFSTQLAAVATKVTATINLINQRLQ
jgi:hypothetical protein